MFKIINKLFVVFFIVTLPLLSEAKDIMNENEFILQITGERHGKSFNINTHYYDGKIVVFYSPPRQNTFTFFDINYTEKLNKQELKYLKLMLLKIYKLGRIDLNPFILSYNRTSIQLNYMDNKITLVLGTKKINTGDIQKLISFIIKKADGKLDFLSENNDYFSYDLKE